MIIKSLINVIYRSKSSLTLLEAIDIAKNNHNVIFLDVRSVQEYEEGHITGSINIPVYELQENARKILKNKEEIIIAYCSAGIRSKRAIKILKDLGYKNVYHIENGIE